MGRPSGNEASVSPFPTRTTRVLSPLLSHEENAAMTRVGVDRVDWVEGVFIRAGMDWVRTDGC